MACDRVSVHYSFLSRRNLKAGVAVSDHRKSDVSDKEAPTPVPVIYIAGSGRSGSTLLTTLLGEHPALASVGELERLPGDGWLDDDYCACGRRVRSCDFWSAVLERWSAFAGDESDASDLLTLQRRFTHRRSLPRLLVPAALRGRQFREFDRRTGALLRAIADTADVRAVVDSSKAPERALALARAETVDLRIVHLVRDGRGVLSSLQRGFRKDERAGIPRDIPPRPTWRVASLWLYCNLFSEVLRTVVGRESYVRVRYEDLVKDPSGVLASLEEVVGQSLRALGERAARGDAFTTGHIVAGNRIRMQDRVRLRPDVSWHDDLEDGDRRLFRLLTWPLMFRYGYGKTS